MPKLSFCGEIHCVNEFEANSEMLCPADTPGELQAARRGDTRYNKFETQYGAKNRDSLWVLTINANSTEVYSAPRNDEPPIPISAIPTNDFAVAKNHTADSGGSNIALKPDPVGPILYLRHLKPS